MLGMARDEIAPLLGRSDEQRLLASLFDEVATHGQTLVLRGEPGIGNSRLLSEAAREARARGMSVLTATGVQAEAHCPLPGCISCCVPCACARLSRGPAMTSRSGGADGDGFLRRLGSPDGETAVACTTPHDLQAEREATTGIEPV